MKLKKLQMQGFKSFADRTEIQFDQNIVAVVGPNGCGKSNIVDAIRWTMGEQSAKGLRGKDMADVIFAGTPSRKSASFAESSLVFDNADQSAPSPYTEVSEIMVTRRLYRSGESEYLINNVQVRLKDVHDLFLGTGSSAKAYSIVAQGKVDQIVLAKPEDRRFLIEEAAGIAKYKVRKQAAERKIEATNQNLSRVQDILRELERNAKSLERQVERAEKFREIQRNLRDLDARVVAAKVKRIDQKAVLNEDLLVEAKDKLQATSTALQECEANLERLRFESLNQEKFSGTEIENLMRKKEELSQTHTELELGIQKVQLLQNQISEREKDIERLKGKSRDQAEQQDKLKQELAELEQERATKVQELEQHKERVATADSRRAEFETKLQELKKNAEELRTRVARDTQRREMLQAERVDLELQRAGLEEKMEKAESERQLQSSEVEFFERTREQFEADSLRLEESIAEKRSALDASLAEQQVAMKHLADLERREADLQSRLESLNTLEEHQVGYEPGALELKEKTNFPLLMESVQFRPEYRELGEILMSHLGQTVFLDAAESPEIQARWHQFILSSGASLESNCAELLVPESDDLATRLLSGIRLVETLNSELPGAQLSRRGEFQVFLSEALSLRSQGDLKRDQSPFGRKQEREELQISLESLRADLRDGLAATQNLETRIEESRAEIRASEDQLKRTRHDAQGLRLKLQDRHQALARTETTLEKLKTDFQDMDLRLEKLQAQLAEQVDETDLLLAEELVRQAEAELQQALFQKQEVESAWVEFRIAFGALSERVERLKQQCVSVEMTQSEYVHNEGIFQADIRMWSEEIQNIQGRKSDLESRMGDLKTDIESLDRGLAESKEKLSILHRHLEESEASRKEFQTTKEALSEKVQNLELERRELRYQVEELNQILHERYQMSLEDLVQSVNPEALEELEDESKLQKAESEASVLRDRLTKFGDVNLVALQEYEEIKTRLDFMNAQKEDLLRTLDSLQSIIQRINKITEFRFRETFQAINHNFQILFPKLFGGGKAFMKLTDETNLLETGVEIFAEPPGKKVQAMSLLSGGEKAMTSISLIFSLFAYRPSSFCILDEVDAPLDDINTRRYNEIIQEMSALSQFIVITHNKRTMEVASTLFGVTMQEPGCSRLVGVDLHEARSFTGDAA